ncbi:DUF6401 family natural product biosynthesis protein [Saccharothrix sp.]|uniref:DUF6401 family natural product biosynthesis protein n=1 Tax=Saccharothrix sp. TaxID=1873460 RepID=UPI0028126802|nr:DUF6401 family natural product biosynthesis protein [Saccharothrix sp.]
MSARRFLDRLGAEIGMATAVLAPVGVLAAIDQHAASVRDILAYGAPAAAATILLAGYARGVLDEAAAHGWSLPSIVEWAHADWTTLRLAAVCDLARRAEEPVLEA